MYYVAYYNMQVLCLFQMKVRKEEVKGKKTENSTKTLIFNWFKSKDKLSNFFLWFHSRRGIEFKNKNAKRACNVGTIWEGFMVSITKDVLKDTLDYLRRKRENQLRMVREIKKVQHSGAEKLAEYSKAK